MQTIYRAANLVDAQRLVDLLASEGIEAHVQGNYLAGAIGELPAGEMIRVWVHDDDVERARGFVAEMETEVLLAVEDDDDDAGEAAPPRKGGGVPNGLVGLGFGLLIGFGLAYWYLRLPHWSDRVDFDGDGVVDTTYEYEDDNLMRIVDDRNGDGQPDQIMNSRADGKGAVRIDDDFDGRFELGIAYRKNQPSTMESDHDGDGFVEMRGSYVDGVIVELTLADPKTQNVFKRETYEHGRLARSELDADRDGTFEIQRRYDASGEIIR